MKHKIFALLIICCLFILVPTFLYAQDNNNDNDNNNDDDNDNNSEQFDIILPDIDYDDDKIDVYNTMESNIYFPPKDPFLSSLLSFLWMGLGQLYVGESAFRSTFFVITEAALWTSGLLYFFVLQFEYSTYGSPDMKWDEFRGQDKVFVISLILSYVALKIFNVVDAYEEAVNYNRKYFNSSADSTFDISFYFDFTSITININF